MESAGVGICPSVDLALCNDGGCGMAGMVRGRVEKTKPGTWNISFPMAAQRIVDTAIFWITPSRAGFLGNYRPLGVIIGDIGFVLAGKQTGRCFVDPVSCVGEFCLGIELHDLADEFLRNMKRSNTK